MKRSTISAAILGALGLSLNLSANAATEFSLCAGVYELQDNTGTYVLTPDGERITMWGYAQGESNNGVCINTPSSPGPIIQHDGGELKINLRNTLPSDTSLVIPGAIKGMSPITFTAPDGTTRVRSFDKETVALVGEQVGENAYKWPNLQAGTYMYHSGTHPQRQVQMGLYGGVTPPAAAGDQTIFFSEIDPAMHASIANVNGAHNLDDMLSTIDYSPKYFLTTVGGTTTAINEAAMIALGNGATPVVRLFNAGLTTHVPTLYGGASFDITHEDGRAYPNSRKQYSMLLPPLKTKVATLDTSGVGASGGTVRLADSAMAVSNPLLDATVSAAVGQSSDDIITNGPGGLVTEFVVASVPDYQPPVIDSDVFKVVNDSMEIDEGGSVLDILGEATKNDTVPAGATVEVVSQPVRGKIDSDGNYHHEGGDDQSTDSLVYAVTNASGARLFGGVSIKVNPVNDPPVANDDDVKAKVGDEVQIRPMFNDTDPDRNDGMLIARISESNTPVGTLEIQGQVIVFNASDVGSSTVIYTIADSEGAESSANIHLTVAEATTDDTYTPPGGGGSGDDDDSSTSTKPEAEDDKYRIVKGGTLNINNGILSVLANDSLGAKVETNLLEYPLHGEITMNIDGTFVYIHDGSGLEDDHFKYEIYNDAGSATADVELKILPKMNAPRVNNDRANTKTDKAVLIDLLRNDKDNDSALDPNGIVITQAPAHGVVEIVTQGNVRYTPDAGYTGRDHFRYKLKDVITGDLSKRSAKVNVKIRNK